MSFKIEFYNSWPDGVPKKQKHKLYETKKAYNRWWGEHFKWQQYFGFGGIAGFIDGEVDKFEGDVPEVIITKFNEKQDLKS